MKKAVRGGCYIAVLVMLNQCWQRQNGVVETDEGAKLFNQYCSTCHLATGQGGPSTVMGFDAPDIREQTKSPTQLIQIISYGWGKMPGFKDSLSEENMALVAGYVATKIEKHAGSGITNDTNP